MIETIFGILNNERGIELLESYDLARANDESRVTIDALAYFADEQKPGEYEQQANEVAGVVEWLHENNAAALYGEADPRTPAEIAADEDWQDEQNTREAVRPGY